MLPCPGGVVVISTHTYTHTHTHTHAHAHAHTHTHTHREFDVSLCHVQAAYVREAKRQAGGQLPQLDEFVLADKAAQLRQRNLIRYVNQLDNAKIECDRRILVLTGPAAGVGKGTRMVRAGGQPPRTKASGALECHTTCTCTSSNSTLESHGQIHSQKRSMHESSAYCIRGI